MKGGEISPKPKLKLIGSMLSLRSALGHAAAADPKTCWWGSSTHVLHIKLHGLESTALFPTSFPAPKGTPSQGLTWKKGALTLLPSEQPFPSLQPPGQGSAVGRVMETNGTAPELLHGGDTPRLGPGAVRGWGRLHATGQTPPRCLHPRADTRRLPGFGARSSASPPPPPPPARARRRCSPPTPLCAGFQVRVKDLG